jgi:hypothetical protein
MSYRKTGKKKSIPGHAAAISKTAKNRGYNILFSSIYVPSVPAITAIKNVITASEPFPFNNRQQNPSSMVLSVIPSMLFPLYILIL